MQKKEINIDGATVPFYEYNTDEGRVVEFDTSKCGPPEPMVNAMLALKFVDKVTKVIMINHKKPMGLLAKVSQNYDIVEKDLSDGLVSLTFSYIEGKSEATDHSQNSCGG